MFRFITRSCSLPILIGCILLNGGSVAHAQSTGSIQFKGGSHSKKPPLIAAVEDGSATQVAAILKSNPKVDIHDPTSFSDDTPLEMAVEDYAVFHYVYDQTTSNAKKGIDHIDTMPYLQRYQTLHRQDLLIVRMLLDHGAKVNQRDKFGGTPLDTAAGLGNSIDVQVLLAHGADPNIADGVGDTPLMDAVLPESQHKIGRGLSMLPPTLPKSEYRKIALLLLSHGATVNAKDKFGITALMTAAQDPDGSAFVQMLLTHGADPRIKDKKGNTALDYTRANNDVVAIPFLEKAMQGKSRKVSEQVSAKRTG